MQLGFPFQLTFLSSQLYLEIVLQVALESETGIGKTFHFFLYLHFQLSHNLPFEQVQPILSWLAI